MPARPAAPGSAIRAAVPPGRGQITARAGEGAPVRPGPGRDRGGLPAGPPRGLLGQPQPAPRPGSGGAARVHPRRIPPRRATGVRQRLGPGIPPGPVAAAEPGHHRTRNHPGLREDQPAVAEGPGQTLDPVAAEHRGEHQRHRLAVRVIQRFSAFLASPGVAVDSLARVDRPLLERYLADLHQELGGRKEHTRHISALNIFLRAIRQHGWDPALPGGAVFYPEDYPRQPGQLPRALADQVMAQLEQPGNLDRWDNPAYRLITLILMRCGLRISDALKLPFTCVVTDRDGAPYLRYSNHKMKREALVPIDDELQAEISSQQQRVLQRWPDGAPVLLPRPNMN